MMKATRISTIVLSLTCWLSFLVSGVHGQACGLCGAPGQYPSANKMNAKPPNPPNGYGNKDCLSLYIESTGLPPNTCSTLKNAVGGFCCDGSGQSGGTGGGGGTEEDGWVSPIGRGCHNQPKGNEGVCMICMTDEFPAEGDNNSIHARYYGDFTCAQLYDRGRNEQIPSFLCGQLQNFAQRECGCGQFHQACIDDPSKCWNNLSSAEREQRARPGCPATTHGNNGNGNNSNGNNSNGNNSNGNNSNGNNSNGNNSNGNNSNGNNSSVGWQTTKKTRTNGNRSSIRTGASGMGGAAGASFYGGRRVTEADFTVTRKKIAETTASIVAVDEEQEEQQQQQQDGEVVVQQGEEEAQPAASSSSPRLRNGQRGN